MFGLRTEKRIMLQLGWKTGTEQYAPGELLEYAIAAEEAGFDSLDDIVGARAHRGGKHAGSRRHAH